MNRTKTKGSVVFVAPLIAMTCLALGACASKMESGYGVGIQAEREAAIQQSTQKDQAPDTPGMYLALIDRMQAQGLFFASLAHIDAYEKQYGTTPDTILLRADALRQTGQPDESAGAYTKLLTTPLAARGYRGLGLLAGKAGKFGDAAQDFDQSVLLQPTDAATLSDLGYARLRMGDVDGARVPLMKAAELAADNPKILSNLALFLLASGRPADAQSVIAQQKFSPEVQQAIRRDAQQVAGAVASTLHAPIVPHASGLSPDRTAKDTQALLPVETLLRAQLQITQQQPTAQ
jgi:Flp pilus assembly protein TadD